MSRSVWKGPFLDSVFYRKTNHFIKRKNKLKIWSRRSVIPKLFVENFVFVYNGREFKKIFIKRKNIGFKFGDFVFTRNHFTSKKTKKKIK